MQVKDISGEGPTARAYQIDQMDLIDIGAFNSYSKEFNPEKVEKIALTNNHMEHSENLSLIGHMNQLNKIKEPVIYTPDLETLYYGKKDRAIEIHDGDKINLSGHEFEVIILEFGEKYVMYYNEESQTLFSGDVLHLLNQKIDLTEESSSRLREVENLGINAIYPSDAKKLSFMSYESEKYNLEEFREIIRKYHDRFEDVKT